MKEQRCRILFAKNRQMRFTGHLDLVRTWERTFRRAGIPLAYSKGYTPRPLVNLAAPLPLGFTSRGEIGDFWLSEVLPLPEIQSSLENALPPGLEIFKIQGISDLHGAKLPALVTASSYDAFLEEVTPDLTAKIGQLLESTALPWTRKGKSFNLREMIIKLEFVPENAPAANAIFMKLVHLPGATGRPEDVLNALGINHIVNLICRTKIDLKEGGN